MAIFPKIQSPCPYRSNLAAVMDGENCRMCKRQVHDLTAMTDTERLAFFGGCSEDVCVSYRLPVRRVAAVTAAIAALGTPMVAAAQAAPEMYDLIVGGIKDVAAVEFVEDPRDEVLPDLPVLVEDAAPAQGEAPKAEPTEPAPPALAPARPAS